MKLTVPTDALRDALKACAPAVAARPNMPLLGGVLLTVAEGSDQVMADDTATPLTLRTFDFETAVVARVNARVDDTTDPEALPSHRLLTQIAASATGPTMTFVTEGARLVVTSGRATWKLPLMHHDDYPDTPLPPEPSGTLNGQTFREAVERVALAAAHDTPENCRWMSVERVGGALELAATDKYRIHTASMPVRWETGDDSDVRVPAAKLAATVKPLGDVVIGVGWTHHLLALHTEQVTVTTTLAADGGQWVPWRTLMGPAAEGAGGYPDPMLFDADELADAVRQAALVVEEVPAAVDIDITADGALVSAGPKRQDGVGDSAIPVDVKIDHADVTARLRVNAKFMVEAIQAAVPEGGQVQLLQKRRGQPIAFGAPEQTPTVVLMPLRLPRDEAGRED